MPYKDMKAQRVYQRKWQRQRRDIVNSYKTRLKCSKCGESDPAALQFHHKSGVKEAGISRMLGRNRTLTALQKEIDKCVVLCANCHILLHYNARKRAKRQSATR